MEENDLTLISDYLAHQLNVDQRVAVHKRIDQDEAFAALFREQEEKVRLLRAQFRADQKEEIRNQFDQFRAEQQQRRFRWAALTAAAVVAILLAIWLFPGAPASSPEQLALGYLEPYPLNMERGNEQQITTREDSAFQYYRQAQYEDAALLFQALYDSDPGDLHRNMYLAESLSQTGQYQEAADIFGQLSQNSPFQDAAQWRHALNLLLAGDTKGSLVVLDQIRSTRHYRTSQADSLWQRLQ